MPSASPVTQATLHAPRADKLAPPKGGASAASIDDVYVRDYIRFRRSTELPPQFLTHAQRSLYRLVNLPSWPESRLTSLNGEMMAIVNWHIKDMTPGDSEAWVSVSMARDLSQARPFDGTMYAETTVQRSLAKTRPNPDERLLPRSCSGSSTVTSSTAESAPDLSIGLEWGRYAVHSLVTAHKLDPGESDDGPSDSSARLALAENLAQLASAHESFGTALGAVLVNGTYARLLVLRQGLVAVESTAGAGSKRELRAAMTHECEGEGEGAQTVAAFCTSARVGSWPHQMRATELQSAGAYLGWARRAVEQLGRYHVGRPPDRLPFTPWLGDRPKSSDADATPKASTLELEERNHEDDGVDMEEDGEENGEGSGDDELPLGATARSFGVARTLRLLGDALREWRVVTVSPGLIEQLADRITGW